MVSVLASSAVGRVFESRSSQTKCYKICICCCFSMYAALRKKNKDWVVWLASMALWSDIPTHRRLNKWATTVTIQLSVLVWYKADIVIINLFFAIKLEMVVISKSQVTFCLTSHHIITYWIYTPIQLHCRLCFWKRNEISEILLTLALNYNQLEPLNRNEIGRFGALKSDSTHHFFRNACAKSGSLRFHSFPVVDWFCLFI
jgi:hypothetical protein